MSLSHKALAAHHDHPRPPAGVLFVLVAAVCAAIGGCVSGDKLPQTAPALVSTVTIDSGGRQLERGTKITLSATARNFEGATVDIPVTWRSNNEKVAIFQVGGTLLAVDTGITTVTASSIGGVTSAPIAIQVVWVGPANLTRGNWIVPPTISPGAAATG